MSEADMTLTSGGEGGMTDASSWIAAGIVTLRRNAASRSARPLTRYLPVTGQENFDLRAHIESAGHQVGHLFSVDYACCDCSYGSIFEKLVFKLLFVFYSLSGLTKFVDNLRTLC